MRHPVVLEITWILVHERCFRDSSPNGTFISKPVRKLQMRLTSKLIILGLGLGVLAASAGAQWSTSPTTNGLIADGPDEQMLPKIAALPDGSSYVTYFSSVVGTPYWNVFLTKLSPSGAKVWASDVLVSNGAAPAPTGGGTIATTVDYDLKVDSAGNALVVVSDARLNPARDVFAYKLDPAGNHLWGTSGITLCNTANFDKDPRILQTPDGNYTVIWARTSTSVSIPARGVLMQRLDSAGNILLASGGVLVAGSGIAGQASNEVADLAEMVPSDGNNVIVVWVRDTRTGTSPRWIYTQKFDTSAAPLWNTGLPVTVTNLPLPGGLVGGLLYITPRPSVVSDGANGVVVGWHDLRAGGFQYNVWAQRIDSSGTALLTANGVQGSTNALNSHQDATVAFDPIDSSIYLFWREGDVVFTTTNVGVFGQRFDSTGAPQWTSSGLELLPVDSFDDRNIRAVKQGTGITVACAAAITSSIDNIVAWNLDTTGNSRWSTGGGVTPLIIANASSGKTRVLPGNASTVRLPTVLAGSGSSVVLGWEDNRAATNDTYLQRILPNGELGFCKADFDLNGIVETPDIFSFLAAYFASSPTADFDGNGIVDTMDIFAFLPAWFAACQ